MAYVPPKHQHNGKAYFIAFMAVLILSGGIFAGYQYFQTQRRENAKSFSICGLNKEKSMEKLQYQGEVYSISDYMYYGESLNLFAAPYQAEKQDDVKRKNIEITNLCDGDTMIYTMENGADRQIDVSELEPGFYSLSISDNLIKKRLVYKEKLHSEPFYTITRDNESRKITLVADDSLSEPKLTHHALFLQVESDLSQQDVYDVFIDPYGNRILNDIYQPSVSGNGLNEAIEMQWAAEYLKAMLEQQGLKVELAKNDVEEALGYYGDRGIMKKAYASQAKYYLELGMNTADQSAYGGAEIYYSNYATKTLANALMYALKKQTSLTPANTYTWEDHSEGVSAAFLAKGKDGKQLYDMQPSLRESGGRITLAGQFSDAALQNQSFVAETHMGMQALSINFIYLSNPKDASIWKKEKELIMDTLADAFVKAVHVSE